MTSRTTSVLFATAGICALIALYQIDIRRLQPDPESELELLPIACKIAEENAKLQRLALDFQSKTVRYQGTIGVPLAYSVGATFTGDTVEWTWNGMTWTLDRRSGELVYRSSSGANAVATRWQCRRTVIVD